ncbi:MAG: hypothetical protein ACTHJ1_17210 [Bordetella sp.]
MNTDPVRLLIHAPTPASLERARRNLANLLKIAPDAQVELVATPAPSPRRWRSPTRSMRICACAATRWKPTR